MRLLHNVPVRVPVPGFRTSDRPAQSQRRASALLALLCVGAAPLTSCGATEEAVFEGGARETTALATEPKHPPEREESGTLSNDGTYYVAWRSDPEPIPLNELFSIEVRVHDGVDRARAVTGVSLEVGAAMPAHRHGMNVEPVVTSSGEGRFTVEGMLFHMPGDWELHLDVTRGAITERAQFDIHLE